MTTFADKLHKPFYSGDFYREDAVKGRGVGFLLLGLLVLIEVFAVYAVSHKIVEQGIQDHIPQIIEQMPDITFTDGRIIIDKPEPHHVDLFKVEETGRSVKMVFEDRQDSPDAIKDWMIANDVVVLVTHTSIIALTDLEDRELRIFDAREFKEAGIVTKEMMTKFVDVVRKWLWPVLILILIPSLWFYKIVQALFFSFFGMLINKIRDMDLDYQVILRFSSYALYCASVIAVVTQVLGVKLPALLFFLILMAFLYSAIDFVKRGPPGPPRR